MINNPKDFFQQIQNLSEEVALKIKAIGENLASLLSKSDAESTYLKKTDAQSTYLGKTAKAESAKTADTATSATSATKATQDGNGAVISSTYLKSATASSTYLTKSDAQATYLGKDAKAQSATFADSATTATSASSALKATQDADGNVISGTYLKNANAESTYLTKAHASSTYLSKTDASSTYLEKTGKAASATIADSATKATQDGNGAVIANTYVKTVNNASPVNGNVNVDIALTKDKITSALGYTPLQTAPVTSVNGKTGAVTIDVGGTTAYKIPYATCSTASTTESKVATISNGVSLSLVAGALVVVKFSKTLYGDEYDSTFKFTKLNVNSTGEKTVKTWATSGLGGVSPSNQVYLFVYDGTYWNMVSVGKNWSTYDNGGGGND